MMYRAMIDPAIGALLAGAFALLFIGAALQKLRSPERFAELFRAYRVVPDGVARLSWLVPVLELTTGAGLLAGGSRAGACAVGAALLLSYAAAMAINLQRGRRDLACGWRTRRAARDCRVDGVAESPARRCARRDAAALAHTGDDGGGCPHDRCRDGGGRTLIYECRPAARARGAR